MWTAWNIFVVCFYYEVGLLRRVSNRSIIIVISSFVFIVIIDVGTIPLQSNCHHLSLIVVINYQQPIILQLQDLPVMNLGCTTLGWLPHGLLGCSDTGGFVGEVDNSTSVPDNFTLDPTVFSQYTEAATHLSTPLLTELETDLTEETNILLTEPWLSTVPTTPMEDGDEDTTTSKLLDEPVTVEFRPFDDVASNDSYPVDAPFLESPEPLGGERGSLPLVPLSYRTLQVIHAAVQCFLAVSDNLFVDVCNCCLRS